MRALRYTNTVFRIACCLTLLRHGEVFAQANDSSGQSESHDAVSSDAVTSAEIELQGPLRERVCIALLARYARPAVAEWSYWIGAGAGWRSLAQANERASLDLRIGGAVDFSVARVGNDRYPLSNHQPHGGVVDLRLGPWIQASTSLDDAIFEGGLMLTVGQMALFRMGTIGLRFGVGSRVDGASSRLTGSVTLTWGIRFVAARYSDGGVCDDESRHPRADHGFASGVRVFATARRDADQVHSLMLGLEFDPNIFLPPYGLLQRWAW